MSTGISYNEFLENLTPMQGELIAYLDKRFIEIEGVARKMRYKVPFYDHNTWICYLNPIKKTHVELCFLYAKTIVEHYPVLDMRGRKMVAGLMLDPEEDIPAKLILSLIHI